MNRQEQLKQEIFAKTKEYYELVHKPAQSAEFIPGKSKISYAGRIFDEKEMVSLVDSSLDFWLTAGRYAEKFEKDFAEFLGVEYCLLTNSGSSANLLAFMALTSPKLGARSIKRGDEVITVAAGFPTTVAPIIQYGAVPVFVDVVLPTYNIDCSQLEAALSAKTKAVMIAHTLGNPFDIEKVKAFCDEHNLWLIEDNCDALGSKYHGKYTGTFGQIATFSFYPAHHITMGEGGALVTNDTQLHRIIGSFRDWGRDCWCDPGKDDTCRKRFEWQLGSLPFGYDHKYIYSHHGYNLKVTDMQAAIGVAQLEKLPAFIEARQRNFQLLYEGLRVLEEFFILPEATPGSNPSWFGFPLAVRSEALFTRNQVVQYLESNRIATRMLFGGNLIRQPAYQETQYRVIGELKNSDFVMNQVFWIGVYPGLSSDMLAYMLEIFRQMPAKLS